MDNFKTSFSENVLNNMNTKLEYLIKKEDNMSVDIDD